MVTAFLGMRGTGDWATDERPKNWRQGILHLYPNGSAPLTGLLSKMSEEMTDDAEFNWWTKLLPTQGGAITGVYTNSGLSVAYTSSGATGDTLYIKMAEATADEFRAGHQVLLRDASHLDVDVNAKVTAVTKAGANSYLTVKLLEADDNGASTDLSNADTVLIIGNINAEGAAIPDAIAYDPDKWYNYTQIFRTPLEITRTARKTKLRTADAYKEQKREALELHSIEMEKAFFWGIRTENTGSNGKPERTTMGLINAIKTGASSNVFNFPLDTNYSGDEWLESGEIWLDTCLEQIFRYGSGEKMVFAGSGAILGINRLVKHTGQIQLQPTTAAYGIKVMQWITPFGTVYLKTHPLFSYETTTRNAMVVFEPSALKYRYIDDTQFMGMNTKEVSPSHERLDGTKEEWLTECGLEFHHPNKFGYLLGVGVDNSL
jgi:Family of unknown function (DUF5309)